MPGKCQSFSIKTTNEIELKMEFITIFIVRGHTHKSESNKTIKLKWRSNTNRKKNNKRIIQTGHDIHMSVSRQEWSILDLFLQQIIVSP